MNSKTMNGDERCIQETSFVIGNLPMGKRIRVGEKIYYFIYIFLEKFKYEV